MDDTELFFLVEYGTENHIERRHLFKTNKEAKKFCKKDLYATYNEKSGYWVNQDTKYRAKIIILILNKE
jgi:hypothetical protein